MAIVLNGEPDDDKLTEWVKTLAQYNLNYSIVAKKIRAINAVQK